MPQSLPLSSNPSFKKKIIIPFKTRKKNIKNWSKSPQSRERTRSGNCSLLLPQGEQGRDLRGNSAVDFHTHTSAGCVFEGSPPSQQCHSPEILLLQLQTLGVGKVQTTSVQKLQWFLCVDDTFGVRRAVGAERFLRSMGQGLSPRDGDLPLVPLSHETGWVYNQRKGSQSF